MLVLGVRTENLLSQCERRAIVRNLISDGLYSEMFGIKLIGLV